MNKPEVCVVLGEENKACRLIKSLHGLKQAPKVTWKFDYVLISNGFCFVRVDKSVYV